VRARIVWRLADEQYRGGGNGQTVEPVNDLHGRCQVRVGGDAISDIPRQLAAGSQRRDGQAPAHGCSLGIQEQRERLPVRGRVRGPGGRIADWPGADDAHRGYRKGKGKG